MLRTPVLVQKLQLKTNAKLIFFNITFMIKIIIYRGTINNLFKNLDIIVI